MSSAQPSVDGAGAAVESGDESDWETCSESEDGSSDEGIFSWASPANSLVIILVLLLDVSNRILLLFQRLHACSNTYLTVRLYLHPRPFSGDSDIEASEAIAMELYCGACRSHITTRACKVFLCADISKEL